MALITLTEIKKDYRLGKTVIHALKGLSFKIHRGEFVAIMGPSGCGKTTLLNIMGCLDSPTGGKVLLEGKDLSNISDDQQADIRLKRIGFIFQSFNLVPVLSARENIEFPVMLSGIPKKERKERVDQLIEMVGLKDYAKHKPDELSGGQRQRVAIARALVHRPKIVIADEPTANLDSENGEKILEVMRSLNENENVTFLFSTHNPEILRYAQRTIRLKDGLIVEDKTVVDTKGR